MIYYAVSKILDKLALTPTSPGVYLMKDAAQHIIYVGKAKSLRNRLANYFVNKVHDAKVTAMLEKVTDYEYFVCETERDALGLEANLIKKHKPHYNILLKDNKSFPYIKITDAQFPYLEVTRKITRGGKYFGPYYNGIRAGELLEVITDIFPVRTCRGGVGGNAPQSCLNYQIGRCSGPCTGAITREDYALIIEKVKDFLRGERDHGARKTLTQKMQVAADMNRFELAIKYRDGIAFLDKLKERTITQVGKNLNCDVFGITTAGGMYCVTILTIRAGKLIGIQNFADENRTVDDEDAALQSFIMQYYTENAIPEQVVAKYELAEVARALNCHVFNPKAALKKRLLKMAEQNAAEYLQTSIEKIQFKNEFTLGACEELARVLALPTIPKKIECYDISHQSGENQVASMVVFVDGAPSPKLYRKFRIKHNEGNNDFKSMQEVLTRRLARLTQKFPSCMEGCPEGAGWLNVGVSPTRQSHYDESFSYPPDLIIVDGGKPQLSAALTALETWEKSLHTPFPHRDVDLNPLSWKGVDASEASGRGMRDTHKGTSIFVISLAKREEEIFVPHQSDPIILPKRSYALRLVQRIRDEAHRFAITYHKKLRSKVK